LQQVQVGGEDWQDMLNAFGPAMFEYTPELERMKIENDIYFVPSTRAPPLSARLPPGQQAYYVEDEGLFVGVLPVPTLSRLGKVENRFDVVSCFSSAQQ
jgi:hypothetical protein